VRHPGPPGYVHPCGPAWLPPLDTIVPALREGMCPYGHALEPVPPEGTLGWETGHREGVCHGCCPCTRWGWERSHQPDGLGYKGFSRARFHVADIPEGAHC
jgi:hypothetical protein